MNSDVRAVYGVEYSVRVALVLTRFEGGAGIAACRLAAALNLTGNFTASLTYSEPVNDSDLQVFLEPENAAIGQAVNLMSREENLFPGATIVGTGYPGISFEQLEVLRHFDVINLHWVQGLLTNEAVAWIAQLGKPVVWTLHDMNPMTGICHYSAGCEKYRSDCLGCPQLADTYGDFPAAVLAAKLAYWPKNIVVVSPSQWLADQARQSAVFRETRIKVIPNALDTETFRPRNKAQSRKDLGLPQDKTVLLFTCHDHAERRKGFKELVEAAGILKSHPQRYHIVTLGIRSSEISALGIEYTSLDFRSDEEFLSHVYSSADATVCPSLEDNLPNILLESIACGTPVAAFDSGGIREVVTEGETGYLAETGNCEELAKAIQRTVNKDMSSSCRAVACEKYALSVQGQAYSELMADVMSTHQAVDKQTVPRLYPQLSDTVIRCLGRALAYEISSNNERLRVGVPVARSLRAVRQFFRDPLGATRKLIESGGSNSSSH